MSNKLLFLLIGPPFLVPSSKSCLEIFIDITLTLTKNMSYRCKLVEVFMNTVYTVSFIPSVEKVGKDWGRHLFLVDSSLIHRVTLLLMLV